MAIPGVSELSFERRPSALYALNQASYLVAFAFLGISWRFGS